MRELMLRLAATLLVTASLCAHAQATTNPPPDSANYQGLWWGGAAESGWNLNLSHQGDVIFATWATYDGLGKPIWFSVTATKDPSGGYAGTLKLTYGPGYYRPNDSQEVGEAVFAFDNTEAGYFSYNVFGIEGSKAIVRYQPALLQPACRWNAVADPAAAGNLQDLWLTDPAGSETGSAVGIANMGLSYFGEIYATWLTYDANGGPTWFFGTGPEFYGDFDGTLYRATGPSLLDETWDRNAVSVQEIGSIGFHSTDGNHVTMSTTVGGLYKQRKLTRYVFSGSGTTCSN
jgi:hypothetical protein